MPDNTVSLADKVKAARQLNPTCTAAELAREFGVSRERIRQVLEKLGLPTRFSRDPGLRITNREQLLGFRADFGFTQSDIAVLLMKATRRPCSFRIVQAWETAEGKPSARSCPDWAIAILADYRKKLSRKQSKALTTEALPSGE